MLDRRGKCGTDFGLAVLQAGPARRRHPGIHGSEQPTAARSASELSVSVSSSSRC
jgi:hypothetical protein